MMLPVLPVCFCTCRVSIPEALSATARVGTHRHFTSAVNPSMQSSLTEIERRRWSE
jgi:hypothetical protein